MSANYATDVSPIVGDIETYCDPVFAAAFMDPVVPDARLKDPDKIAADIASKEAARTEKLALDWNLGRIVALGWWISGEWNVTVCKDELDEKAAITEWWVLSKHRTIVGFNIKGFDLKYLIQRSRLLGIAHPMLDLGKYSRKGITDLFLELTFNEGHYDNQGSMRRTLTAFCRRFGIPADDPISGRDIPQLVSLGCWDAIAAHCRNDVLLTVALAQKLGVVQPDAVKVP